MGRAGRPTDQLPPQLRELEEEGLPDGWGGYWHGERKASQALSELVPDVTEDLLKSAAQGDIMPYQLWKLLEHADTDKIKEGDPFIDSLLEGEWKKFEDFCKKIGCEDLFNTLHNQRDGLNADWKKALIWSTNYSQKHTNSMVGRHLHSSLIAIFFNQNSSVLSSDSAYQDFIEKSLQYAEQNPEDFDKFVMHTLRAAIAETNQFDKFISRVNSAEAEKLLTKIFSSIAEPAFVEKVQKQLDALEAKGIFDLPGVTRASVYAYQVRYFISMSYTPELSGLEPEIPPLRSDPYLDSTTFLDQALNEAIKYRMLMDNIQEFANSDIGQRVQARLPHSLEEARPLVFISRYEDIKDLLKGNQTLEDFLVQAMT